MKIIKKDWMYDINMVMYPMIIGMLGLGIAFLLFLQSSEYIRETMYHIYDKFYKVICGVMCMYPVFAFKTVCPQMGSDKLYLSTANLPYSRKEVFFKSLKNWIIITLVFMLVGALVITMLNPSTSNFSIMYLYTLVKPLVIIVFAAILQLQIISAIIFCLAKEFKWYKVLVIYIFTNTAILTIYGSFMFLVNGNIQNQFIVSIIIAIFHILGSIIVFLISWRNVENIWQ